MHDVYSLMVQLAEYERNKESILSTPADFERDHADGKFSTLLAVNAEGKAVGMALYFRAYSTWKGSYLWLEDLVVDPQYRGMGIGGALWNALVAEAKAVNSFMKWQVLDWNTPAFTFYEKLGGKQEPEWITCRLSW